MNLSLMWYDITNGRWNETLLCSGCPTGALENVPLCLFVCLFARSGLTSLLNMIWGHTTTVPDCSSGTLTNVLPHRNTMQQTQDMTPHPVTVYRKRPTCRCAIHWCGTSHWNTQLPILMSWVRPDREILPRPSSLTSIRPTLRYCYGGSQSEAR